jgi:hypothetical protein
MRSVTLEDESHQNRAGGIHASEGPAIDRGARDKSSIAHEVKATLHRLPEVWIRISGGLFR